MTAAVVPYALRTEYAENPIGIDETRPRFSWLLRVGGADGVGGQAAYQVVVGTDLVEVRNGQGGCWDSGRVESAATGQVEFDGAELRSATEYVWSVRSWDGAGEVSEWSEPATFETGLLSPDDWGVAAWIGRRDSRAAVVAADGLAAAVADASPAADASVAGADAAAAASGREIGDQIAPAPLLRKAFRLAAGQHGGIVRARLYVCGLGFGEYHLDGQRVG
ncbi:MAG TPA: hypothetical protein VE287_00830, partial [Actinopolymorphaceae bacterium]|nr:hypothetical protein [Actinopolymorphaceae bacterium]